MIDHVIEVQEEKDRRTHHVNDQVDRTDEEVDHDHVTGDETDQILEIEVTQEDLIENEVDHQEAEDDQDHHHHHIEVAGEVDAVDLDVVAAVDVVAGVIEAAETTEEITGVEMILMVSMVNQNRLVEMTICLLMDSRLLRLLLTVEVDMVTMVVTVADDQTMTEAILDVTLVGTAITVENVDRPVKVKNGQGTEDGSQMDLR